MEEIINFLKQMWKEHPVVSAIILFIIIGNIRARTGVKCANCKTTASRKMFKEKGCPSCGSDKFNSLLGLPGTLIFYGIYIFLGYTIYQGLV